MATTIPKDEVNHVVVLTGLDEDNDNDGRYIRVDIIENNQYKSGYYFCGTNHRMINGETWFADALAPSYHLERSVKFSICQDETLNQCQEFGSDHYTIFKNADGKLEIYSSPLKFWLCCGLIRHRSCTTPYTPSTHSPTPRQLLQIRGV